MPPLVTVPTVVGGPSSRVAAKPTSSFSIVSRLGNAVGSSPLEPAYAATASRPDPVGLLETGVVDVGQRAAAGHRHVAGLHLLEAGQDVVALRGVNHDSAPSVSRTVAASSR